jgi:hypothetical protein
MSNMKFSITKKSNEAMRKTILNIAFLVGVIVAITSSCYYEYPPEPLPITPEDVSFNTHILPILVEKCATNECHDGSKAPDLREENAYRELTSKGYCNTTFPKQSKLYLSLTQGVGGLVMPPSGPLSTLDQELIVIWMEKGTPND